MSKVSKPKQSSICRRNRNGRKYYYCWIKGTQYGLGYDWDKANLAYNELRSNGGRPKVQPQAAQPQAAPESNAPASVTVAFVLCEFLAWVEKNRSKETHIFNRRAIKGPAKERRPSDDKKPGAFVPFLDFIGNTTVDDFGKYHVKEWIDTHFTTKADGTPYSATYQNCLMRPIKAAFRWACSDESENASRKRLLSDNPINGLKMPSESSRQVYITPEQWAVVESKAQQPFLDFLIVLRETGARPQELRKAEAVHLQANNGAPHLYFAEPVKKTRGKQKPRKIYLNERALAICKSLAAKHPTGPLFRNEDGNAWTKDAIGCKCKRMKLVFSFYSYALRHTFCTDKLKQGVPPATVAQLMGNSVEMVMKVYNQLGLDDAYLYDALTQRNAG